MSYIKREDALNALLHEMVGTGYQSRAMDAIKFLPTSDVVPKGEVEELIRENESLAKTVNEASSLMRKLRSKVEKSQTKVAREIFEEIEKEIKQSLAEYKNQKLEYNIDDALFHLYHGTTASQMGMLDFIAKLKNKYISGEAEEIK